MNARPRRLLVHLSQTRRRPLSIDDIFWIEAVGHDTLVRLHGARRLRDSRKLGEVFRLLEPHGFVRVHDNHAVNPERIFEIRRRPRSQDWEVRLEPPVNRVLPVSRSRLHGLWRAYGER